MAGERNADLTALAARFADPDEFQSSPLYRALAATVAREPKLLQLAAQGQPGQHPAFLFFAAVHALLLSGVRHPLERYYPSTVGEGALPPDAQAGLDLVEFCTTHAASLSVIIRSRLVQSNVVKRALAIRLGLAVIGRELSTPVHLIEVGASAGLLLRLDRYGFTVGGQPFGDLQSPVQIEAEWRGASSVPDLDRLPPFASVTGIDLHPLDATRADDRFWLEALVWPENRYEADLLHRALALVADDPPTILAGDAVRLCPALAAQLPAGEPRVVFHSMTRMHVPHDQLRAFDAAIATLGQDAPLYHLSLEGQGELNLGGPDGRLRQLARVGGRVEWIASVDL